MLIPTRHRTWHPRGQTPIVRYNYKHDRISAIAALSVAAKRARLGLYLQLRQNNFKAVHVARFLRLLLRHLRGPIILLWDSGSIHKGPAIQRVRDAFPRLQPEPFPGYAPELNPVEPVWNDFKGHREQHPSLQAGHPTRPAWKRSSGSALARKTPFLRPGIGPAVSTVELGVLLFTQDSIV